VYLKKSVSEKALAVRSFIYATYPKSLSEPLDFLFCLAPSWVFQAIIVTVDAVSSYLTVSPLPLKPLEFKLVQFKWNGLMAVYFL